MTDDNPRDEIQARLREIGELDIDRDLARTTDLGTAGDFSAYQDLFGEIQRFARSLSDLAFYRIGERAQQEILGPLNELQRTLTTIKGFDQRPGDRASVATALQEALERLKEKVIPQTGYLYWQSLDFERYRGELERVTTEARTSIEGALDDLEAKRTEAEEALAAIRSAAAETGVSQEASTFHEAAQRYEAESRKWLWGAVAAGLVTVAVAFVLVLFWDVDGPVNDAANLQLVLAKAAALAVLTYGTVTAVRLYRSTAHLAAVNRHREDALRTFRAFVEGTESGDVKDKVLLAAAHAAFGQTATGFIGEKGDSGSVVELLDGISGSLIRRS